MPKLFSVYNFSKNCLLFSRTKFLHFFWIWLAYPLFGSSISHDNNITWDFASESFLLNNQVVSSVKLYEGFPYIFRNQLPIGFQFIIGSSVDSYYEGNDLLNNQLSHLNEYLLWVPTKDSPRDLFAYNPIKNQNSLEFDLVPFDSINLSNNFDSLGLWGYSMAVDDSKNLFISEPNADGTSGKVHLYRFSDSDFQFVKSVGPISEDRTHFGAGLSLGEGELFVSAPDEDGFTGAVYTFSYDQNNSLIADHFSKKFTGESTEPGSLFGWSMACSGNFLAISALNLASENVGEIYLYRKMQTWEFFDVYTSTLVDKNQEFGYDVALNDNFLVVGVPGYDSPESGKDCGAVLVYDFKNPEVEPLFLFPDDLSADDRFGNTIAMEEDQLFVGAIQGDGVFQDTGVIYVFEYNQTTWNLEAKITPPNASKDQQFSHQISIASNSLVTLAPKTEFGGMGYVYKQSEKSWDLVSSISLDHFLDDEKNFLSLDAVGENIFIGNPNHDDSRGGVTFYYNPAWGEISRSELSPVIFGEFPLNLEVLEDDEEGITYDFNASHPYDMNFTWEVIETNASFDLWDINDTSGVFSYLPDSNFSGKHSFTISALSGKKSVDRFFSVSVLPHNDAPVFLMDLMEDQMIFREGVFQSFRIPIFDSDSENLNIQIADGTLPAGLALFEDRIEGVPVDGAALDNNYEVTLLVTDSEGMGTEGIFDLLVYPKNSPPDVLFEGQTHSEIKLVFSEDFQSSLWNERISQLSVSDPDGDKIGMQLMGDPPQNGELILSDYYSESLDIKFFADPDFAGFNSFRIKFYDLSAPDIFSVIGFRIETKKVNDPPVIKSSPPAFSIHENHFFYHQFDLYDPDLGDALELVIEGLPSWINFDGKNTIWGTPNRYNFLDQARADLIAVVYDQTGENFSQVFSVEIIPQNYPPKIIFEGNTSVKFLEDTSEFFTGLLKVDDNDTVDTRLEWEIYDLPNEGNFSYEYSGSDFIFRYKPNSNFFGHDQVTIKSTDKEDPLSSDSITFNFEVSNIPDPPVFHSSPYTGLLKGTPWKYEIIVSDSDLDTDLIVQSLTDLPAWLTLKKKSADDWVLSGLVPSEQDSTLQINLRVTDSQGQYSEQSFELFFLDLSEIGQVEIKQQEIGEQIINEDNNWSGGSLSVDAFPGRKITWSMIENPEFGEFLYEEKQNGTIEEITYVPNANFHGMDSLVIQASDGFSSDLYSIKFRIMSVDDKPEFISFSENLLIEDRDYLDQTISFSDGDGFDNLSYSSESIPSWIVEDLSELDYGKVRLTGSPGMNNVGEYLLKFSVVGLDDGLSEHKNLNLSVQLLNAPPVVYPEQITVSMVEDDISTWVSPDFSASDLETTNSNNLLWQIHDAPEGGSANIDPFGESLLYIPDANFSGIDTFSIKVTDLGGAQYSPPRFTKIPVEVNVLAVNDRPTILTEPPSDQDDSISWTDEFPYTYNFIAYDSDAHWQGFPKVSLETPLPKWANWHDDGNGSVRIYGHPSFLDIGNYPFLIKVRSGEDEIFQSFELEIRVDDYPPAVRDKDSNELVKKIQIFLSEDTIDQATFANNFNFSAINPDPEEGDLNDLIWSIAREPTSGATLEITGNGEVIDEISYKPMENFYGLDEFSIQVSEGDRKSIIPVSIFIRSIPDPPYFTKPFEPKIKAKLGEFFAVELEAFDPEGESISYNFFTNNQSNDDWLGILSQDSINGSLSIGGIPPLYADTERSIDLTVVAMDSTGRFSTTQTELSFEKVNRPPLILADDQIVVFFDNNLSTKSSPLFPIFAYDADGDITDWTLSPYNLPNFGEVLLIENNDSVEELRYIPSGQVPSRDDFTLLLSDGNSSSEILIKAIFDRSDFYINFPDEVPDVFENKSFQIQFFVQDSDTQLEPFKAELKEAPSWITLHSTGNKNFFVQGLPLNNSAGEYSISIRVTHPNGLAAQNINFNLRVNGKNQARLDLLGSEILPVKSGLEKIDFNEPGYFAKNAFGEDITSDVEVSFPSDVRKGKNIISYTTNEASRTRVLLGHDKMPFVDFSETQTKLNPVFWGEHIPSNQVFFLCLSPESKFLDSEEFKSGSYSIYSESSTEEGFAPSPIAISANHTFHLSDFKIGNSHLWVNGIKQIDSSDSIIDENIKHCFVDCYDLNGNENWQLHMKIEGNFDSNFLVPSINDEVLICGQLSGEIEIGSGSFFSQQPQWIGFIISEDGEPSRIFTIDAENLDSETAFFSENSWKVMSTREVVDNELHTELIRIDKLSNPFIKANFQNVQITQANYHKGNIYVFGENQKSNGSNFPSYFLGEIHSSNSFSWEIPFISQSQDSEISKILTIFDEFDRIQILIEFSGAFVFQEQDFVSSGESDLLLLCISRIDGTLLWSGKLGGEGNDSLEFAFSNEVGLTDIGIRTEMGAIFVNQKIEPTEAGTLNILNLVSTNALPSILNQKKFEFEVDKFASYEIEITNTDLFKLFIEDGPDWLKLFEYSGVYYLSGSPKIEDYLHLKEKIEEVVIHFIGTSNEHTFIKLPLKITLPPEWQMSNMVIPSIDDLWSLEGDVQKHFTQSVPNGYLVYGNYKGKVELDSFAFSTFARSAGFVFYTDSDFSFKDGYNFSASGSTSLVDLKFQSSKELFVVGNFSGTLKVGDTSLRSRGGTDVFIAVINLSSKSVRLFSIGGEGNEFATSCSVNDTSLFLSGYFYDDTNIGGVDITSLGTGKDAFIAKLTKNNLAEVPWVFTFGGDGDDVFNRIEFCGDHIAAIADFSGTANFGQHTISPHGTSDSLIAIFDENGNLIKHSVMGLHGDINSNYLSYSQNDNNYIVAGTFEGEFFSKYEKIKSKSSDLFISIFGKDLSIEAANNFGGSNDQAMSAFEVLDNGFIYVGGEFTESITFSENEINAVHDKDAFVSIVDKANLKAKDFILYQSEHKDWVSSISVNENKEILVSGNGDNPNFSNFLTDSSNRNNLFVSSHFHNYQPGGYVEKYGKIPTNYPFSLAFKTYGWLGDLPEFSLESINLPPWMLINMGDSGKGNLSGFSPKKPGIYPFDFTVREKNGESVLIKGELETFEGSDLPQVLFPDYVEVVQFDTSRIDLLVENLKPEHIIYSIDFPVWANLIIEESADKAVIEISPNSGTTGSHVLKVLVKSKVSSFYELIIIDVKVIPNEENAFGHAQPVYETWNDNWLGKIFLKENGWGYHLDLGWIYLLHKLEDGAFWIWNSTWGWLWTNDEYWDGSEGYLFSNKFDGWLFFTSRYQNNLPLIYNFQNEAWVSFIPRVSL